MRIPHTLSFVACLVALGLAGGLRAAGAPHQLLDHFTNLQILPKDSTRASLVPMMKQFTFDLGVRCEHCHKGGPDLATFDFPSDEQPAKKTARVMMQMVATINGDLLKGVGASSTTPKVTCYTCHRGTTTPLTTAPAGPGRGGIDLRR